MHYLEAIRRLCNHQMPRLGLAGNRIYQALRPRHIRSEIVPSVIADLDLGDDTANNIFYLGGRYEQPTLKILHSWASNGANVFFDIGANFGFFSFALLQKHPSLRAVALEPHPVTFQRLKNIAVANRLPRLDCLQMAASDRSAELPFFSDERNSGASHIQHLNGAPDGQLLVQAMPFDEIVTQKGLTNVPSFAKIDVEGHELAVLHGMIATLSSGYLRGICIEMNVENLAAANTSPQEIRDFLNAYKYRELHSLEISRGHSRRYTDNCFFERNP